MPGPETPSDETLVGTANDDHLVGGAGGDTLIGLEGDDELTGGAGNDTLLGGDGDDTLVAGGHDDILVGGEGDDRLNGGGGSDTYVFNFSVDQGAGVSAQSFDAWALANMDTVVGDGMTQAAFANAYTAWLSYVVDLLELGSDLDADGEIAIDINQNDPTGLPQIEGLSAAEIDAIFNGGGEIAVKTGRTSQDRYYSNEAAIEGGPAITGAEGHDVVVQFQDGPNSDTLQLNGLAGLAADDLEALFSLETGDFDNDGVADDTRLSWAGVEAGSITVLDTVEWGTDVLAFFGDARVVGDGYLDIL